MESGKNIFLSASRFQFVAISPAKNCFHRMGDLSSDAVKGFF